MDRKRFRKKVILDLLSSPWTLIPAAGGATLLMASWAMGGGADLVAFCGITGLLAGVGSVFTRWIFRSDQIARSAFDELLAEEEQKRERELDALDEALSKDRDPRPETCLRELREMYDSFRKNTELSRKIGQEYASEIANKVEKLFQSCILSLKRSDVLWRTAKAMKVARTRKSLLDEREQIVQEIEASTHQMARALDEIKAIGLKLHEDQQLAQIRQELNESLEVARRVEQRMQSLEAELGGSLAHTEKE